MSSIAFTSPSGSAKVSGAERAYMGCLIRDLYLQALDLHDVYCEDEQHPVYYITRDNYDTKLHSKGDQFRKFIGTSIAVGIDRPSPLQHFDGEKMVDFEAFHSMLNTTLAIGSDPMKLYARLHGQCEVHCFVEGVNRNWLADIIQKGLNCGLYRSVPRGYAGWDGIIEFLRQRDDEEVVCSYSVCDGFPNMEMAVAGGLDLPFLPGSEDEEYDYEAWDALTSKERWDWSMKAIRENGWLELTPEKWEYPAYHFGEYLVTGFHLYAGALLMKAKDPKVIALKAEREKIWRR